MRSIGLLVLVSAVAFGQQRPSAARPGPVVIYPGSGRAPVAGYNGGYNGYASGRVSRPRSTGAVVYVPYSVGGYSYYGPQSDYAAPVIYPDQQGGAAPTVVINQNFIPQTANPVVREYVPDASGGIQLYQPQPPQQTAQPPDNSSPDAPTFLIAFKDHTIYAAVGYWVEGQTLHYLTSGNTHNQVSLDLVDRDLSARLNGERGVDFLLPPARR